MRLIDQISFKKINDLEPEISQLEDKEFPKKTEELKSIK